MHKYRQAAKKAAWYDDKPVSFRSPFRRQSSVLIQRANRFVDDAAANKPEDGSEDPKAGEQLNAVENELFAETSDDIDVESKTRPEKPWRYHLLRLVAEVPWIVDRWFPAVNVTKKQNAAAAARAVLAEADNLFKDRVRPQAVLAELTFVKVNKASTKASSQDVEEAQLAISSVQSAANIDLESIRKSSRRGIKILYVYDDENLSQRLVMSSFIGPAKDRAWRRFCDWAVKTTQRRGAMRKSAHWFPTRMDKARSLEFALGLEHCARFFHGEQQDNPRGLLKEIVALHDCGKYEESSFARVSPFHKRSVYFYQLDAENEGKENSTTIDLEPEETIFKDGPQFLMIITQTKPCHYMTDEPGYSSWTDYAYWRTLLEPYVGRVQHGDLELYYHGLIRDIITGVLREADEAWNARIVEVGNDIELFASRVYENPSDIVSSDHLWSLSQYLSEIHQAIGAQAELMQLVQEALREYAQEQAKVAVEDKAAELWSAFSKDAWLDPLVKEMKDSEQSVQDGLIRDVDRLLDRVYKTVSINDTRRSIELNESLWRLSWVTFIFLPLTFLAGFFGMNVNIFNKGDPDVKWYFIAAVPFMVLVFLLWLAIRSVLTQRAASSQGMRTTERRNAASKRSSSM